MPTAELQLAMHKAGVGPAALIPVPSGTVLLLSPATSLTAALRIALECREIAGRAVVLCWDDVAAISYSVLGRVAGSWAWGERSAVGALGNRAQHLGVVGRAVSRLTEFTHKWFRNAARVDKAAAGLSTAFGVDPEQIKSHVAEWDRGGPDAVTALLSAAGLHDVAQVVGLVHAGHAEPQVAVLARPAPRNPPGYPFLAILVLFGLTRVVTNPTLNLVLLLVTLVLALVVLAMIFSRVVFRGRSVRGKPINAVLPVIPVTQGAVPTEQPPA